MPRESDQVAAQRAALGARLAGHRQRCRLSQRDLAKRAYYDRTSITKIEAGQQPAPRKFWLSVDRLLGADGELVAGFDELAATKNASASGRWKDLPATRSERRPDEIDEWLRPVGLDEARFPVAMDAFADLGLAYPDQALDGIATVTRLWEADLDRASGLLMAPTNVGTWNEASLSWLVGTRHDFAGRGDGRKVGASDIAAIRNTTQMFDGLDGQHGGGHARRAFVEFLRTEVAAVLKGQYGDHIGRQLFTAAAQATLLGAWMSYDAGLHGLAQRYFVQALRLAESTGDRLLGASILDAMSHQATFLGRYREAVNLARAARMGTATAGSPSAAAHFYMMEARALARLGEATECDRAMSAAVREFERRNPDDDPAEWFGYFNDAELAAELGHCNRDLGRAFDASAYASQSLGPAPSGYVRSDFFVTMVLADAYLAQSEVQQACRIALGALTIGERLKSARCGAYIDEFRRHLSQFHGNASVSEFIEQASEVRLWSSADARMVPSHADLRRS